jgi:hypothetical protein
LGADMLAQLSDNLLLIRIGQGRGRKHAREPSILLEDVGKGLQRLGRRVERVGLRGRSVL